MSTLSYVIVSAVRNEGAFLARTIASVAAQTVRPSQWILVDDGSTDSTGALIDSAASRFPWIVAIHRRDRGARQAGGGVVDSFYDGYAALADKPWDLVVKLDGDLQMAPDYFESCLREFEADPQLGIGGGTCCIVTEQGQRVEFMGEPSFHVRGPCKIYRKGCFEDIGGLMRAPGWDTVDQVTANMRGWRTRSFPHIQLVHLRPTGGAYGSWANWTKNGLANYITGYHPLFMVCKCLKRCLGAPSLHRLQEVCGLGYGYLKGLWQGAPRVGDAAVIRYVRSQQWRALTLRSSLWR